MTSPFSNYTATCQTIVVALATLILRTWIEVQKYGFLLQILHLQRWKDIVSSKVKDRFLFTSPENVP